MKMNFFRMMGAWGAFEARLYNAIVGPALSRIYEETLERFVLPGSLAPGARVLDVGCGAGRVLALLGRRFPAARFTGVDLSGEMVARAAAAVAGLPNVEVREGDALALPFAPASFDVVLSLASIKHWPDAARGLREARRVLAPGGTLFLMEVHRRASWRACRSFVRRWRFAGLPLASLVTTIYFRRVVAAAGYAAGELEALCAGAGFAEVSGKALDDLPAVIVRAGAG